MGNCESCQQTAYNGKLKTRNTEQLPPNNNNTNITRTKNSLSIVTPFGDVVAINPESNTNNSNISSNNKIETLPLLNEELDIHANIKMQPQQSLIVVETYPNSQIIPSIPLMSMPTPMSTPMTMPMQIPIYNISPMQPIIPIQVYDNTFATSNTINNQQNPIQINNNLLNVDVNSNEKSYDSDYELHPQAFSPSLSENEDERRDQSTVENNNNNNDNSIIGEKHSHQEETQSNIVVAKANHLSVDNIANNGSPDDKPRNLFRPQSVTSWSSDKLNEQMGDMQQAYIQMQQQQQQQQQQRTSLTYSMGNSPYSLYSQNNFSLSPSYVYQSNGNIPTNLLNKK